MHADGFHSILHEITAEKNQNLRISERCLRMVLCLQKTEFFFDSIARLCHSELKRLAGLMRSLKHNIIQKPTPRVVVKVC